MHNENKESINEGRRRFSDGNRRDSGAAVMTTGLLASQEASAQSRAAGPVNEPAVIGYPNKKGVIMERVTYKARNLGTDIVANVFKPPEFDGSKKYSAIVVTHPFGGVKEQTSGLYAQRMAEEGFISVAFDASYQGESGGAPRLMEVPAQRVDDISCAIDYLVQQPQVAPNRIGSLGICSGGGYAMCNAATELRVKAVATVSMFDLGDARRRAMGLLSYEERMKRLKDACEQRSKEARGEPMRLVKVSPDSPAELHTHPVPRGLRLLPDPARQASQFA
jgi:dienelactone hydrolase